MTTTSDDFYRGFARDVAVAVERAKLSVQRNRDAYSAADAAWWVRQFPLAPERERLLKHVDRFGTEAVNEVASLYKVNLRVAQPKVKRPRQRRSSGELEAQVLDLRKRGRGLVPAAIADVLNVSEKRVRQILAQHAA